ncbi:MAG: hypothetical protein LM580_03235 [Thermofilum sp.]|nr:hypothetical protein [Thermofilum sp.]
MDLVAVDPKSVRRLLLGTNAASSLASRVGFDDSSRLRVRAEYIDDGYVRVRDASGSVDILEILREMSWTFYNLSQQRRLLENLDVALSTRASESTLSSLRDILLYPGNAETFTTTPLGAGAAYYGPTRDFLYSRLTTFGVMGYADQASASNGIYIQLSLDGSNWDYQGATATLSAAGAVSLAQVVTARYARVVWVNGDTAQSAFRLGGRYMIAGSENPPLSYAPPLRIEAVCCLCGRDMTETGDFFVENNAVYCPKCYANKRWKELDAKARAEWVRALRAWLKNARETESERAKAHAPDRVLLATT